MSFVFYVFLNCLIYCKLTFLVHGLFDEYMNKTELNLNLNLNLNYIIHVTWFRVNNRYKAS